MPSKAFFLISNYNTDPYLLTRYCEDYAIIDQSDDDEIKTQLSLGRDPKLKFAKNSGTSLINYLNFIIEKFDDLPPLIAFLKGNVIGRHISHSEFERRISNTFYTYLWDEETFREKSGVAYKPQNNRFIEINNSWYVPLSHHRYFVNFDEYMSFFFSNHIRSRMIDFCPGACFLTESERITQHPKSLYLGLRTILEYEFFPSEAWMVERSLNMILTGDLIVNDWVKNPSDLSARLEALPNRSRDFVAMAGPLKPVKELFASAIFKHRGIG